MDSVKADLLISKSGEREVVDTSLPTGAANGLAYRSRIPRRARNHVPASSAIVRVERMLRAFTKYHLDNGQVLHPFRLEEPHADSHDHP